MLCSFSSIIEMFCSNCGAKLLGASAKFCSVCGTSVGHGQTSNTGICLAVVCHHMSKLGWEMLTFIEGTDMLRMVLLYRSTNLFAVEQICYKL